MASVRNRVPMSNLSRAQYNKFCIESKVIQLPALASPPVFDAEHLYVPPSSAVTASMAKIGPSKRTLGPLNTGSGSIPLWVYHLFGWRKGKKIRIYNLKFQIFNFLWTSRPKAKAHL